MSINNNERIQLMSKKTTEKKNPLANKALTQDMRSELIDEFWRTNYLINGIRHAVSSGMKVSIFDRIVRKHKGGIGQITKKSIEDFIDEYIEECFPDWEEPECDETINGEDYTFENPNLSISGLSCRCEPYNGKDEIKEYLRGFVGCFIIDRIHARTCINPYLDVSMLLSSSPSDTNIEMVFKDWVIDPMPNSFSFDMKNEDIALLKKDLMFYELVNKYSEECSRIRFENGAGTFEYDSRRDQPFKSLFERSWKAYTNDRLQVSSTFAEEILMEGIESYCFNNELSLHFSDDKKRPIPNENYSLVISELRRTLNNILKMYDSQTGD